MSRRKEHEKVEGAQASRPLAEPPQAPAPAPDDGWIDANKPYSLEELDRRGAIDSPFLASNF